MKHRCIRNQLMLFTTNLMNLSKVGGFYRILVVVTLTVVMSQHAPFFFMIRFSDTYRMYHLYIHGVTCPLTFLLTGMGSGAGVTTTFCLWSSTLGISELSDASSFSNTGASDDVTLSLITVWV